MTKEKIHLTTLTDVKDLNPSVKLFRLSFDKPFVFIAGQFVMTHLTGPDGKPIKRAYSIASSPHQKEFIELCIRKVEGGAATNILHNLKVGDKVATEGPLGRFQLEANLKNDVIFVAGGTGIAPIRSMLQTLPIQNMKNRFYFYFGINTLDDFLFKEELKKLKGLSNFKLILVVKEDLRWEGDKGFISEEIVKKYTPDLSHKEIYMCGPPAMIRLVKGYLPNLGAKPEQVHIDAWE